MAKELIIERVFDAPVGGKTKMTLTHSNLGDIPDELKKDMDKGWSESFDKMDQALM